jgi:hypothetical protein
MCHRVGALRLGLNQPCSTKVHRFLVRKAGAVQVAECCVEALFQEDAEHAVVEIIADRTAPHLPWGQLFAGAKWPVK